ncbi:IclR family transcriptional regulator domain-containing protein [Bacillus massiliigorillae]|uniref:IclR family transcriptional regulator domain-containing protein n=1 Tax=Bacillus massiliigorillae TaxID=1243664 RepID=UPI0009DE887E
MEPDSLIRIDFLNELTSDPVQILTHIGRRNPPHATSSGKVILANQEEEVIKHYITKGLH